MNFLESSIVSLLKPYFTEDSPGVLYAKGAKPPSVRRLQSLLDTYSLADLLPYESYDDQFDVFINTDSYGFAIEISTAISLNEETLETLSALFSGDGFDKDTVVQHLLYASPHVAPTLTNWANTYVSDQDKDDERGRNQNIFRAIARKRVEHLKRGIWESLFEETSVMVRDFRSFITFQKPLPGGRSENVRELHKTKMQGHCKAMRSTLKQAGLDSRVLEPDGLIDLLDTIINAKNFKRERRDYDEGTVIRDQVVSQENLLLVGRDDLYLHNPERDTNVSIFGVERFPDAWAGWGNGELIGSLYEDARRISCPFLVTMTLHYPDQLDQAGTAKVKHQRAVSMSESPIAKSVTSWHDKRKEWEFVTRKLDSDYNMVQVNYQIVLFTTEENKEVCERELMSVYKSKRWILYKQRFVLMPALMMALPMGASQVYTEFALNKKLFKTMLSWSCTNLAPFIAEWKGTGTPLQLLLGFRGQAAYFNPWDNREGNYNIAVAARPGAGKSVFMQDFVMNVLAQGGRAWVFDRGRSFEELNRILGEYYSTQFMAFDGTERISLNPFTHIHNWEGDSAEGSERIMILNLLIQMATRDGVPLPAERQTWLDTALVEAWRKKGNEAEITDVYNILYKSEDIRYRDLADALQPFTREGVFGHYFTGPSNIDLSDDFVVLELRELDDKPQLQTIVLLILMMRITQTMYSKDRTDRKQVCLIDEAWKLLSYGNAAQFIEEGYRTARKYYGCFGAITQGINDFYKSPTTLACLESSDWTVLLAQKDESLKQLANSDRLPGGKENIKLLRKLDTIKGLYSSCAIISPGGLTVARLVIDKFSEMLFTTNSSEVAERQSLQRQGMTLVEALEYQTQVRMEHNDQ